MPKPSWRSLRSWCSLPPWPNAGSASELLFSFANPARHLVRSFGQCRPRRGSRTRDMTGALDHQTRRRRRRRRRLDPPSFADATTSNRRSMQRTRSLFPGSRLATQLKLGLLRHSSVRFLPGKCHKETGSLKAARNGARCRRTPIHPDSLEAVSIKKSRLEKNVACSMTRNLISDVTETRIRKRHIEPFVLSCSLPNSQSETTEPTTHKE